MKKKLLITAFTLTLLFCSICQLCHSCTSSDQSVQKTYLADESGDNKPSPPQPNSNKA